MSPDPTQPPIAPDPPVPDPPAPPAPPVSVDDALKGVIAMEATLNADEASVKNIQTAIDTATAPLAGAQATVANDINMYNTAVDVAIVALQKSKRVPSAPPINT